MLTYASSTAEFQRFKIAESSRDALLYDAFSAKSSGLVQKYLLYKYKSTNTDAVAPLQEKEEGEMMCGSLQ